MADSGGLSRARLHSEPLAAVSHRLLASWHRSQRYGVSLDEVAPVFSGTYDDESLFYRCGREVLNGLRDTLANEPVSMMLTDADGLVLDRVSADRELLAALDRVHLAPGFSYAEDQAGTNGLALALADQVPAVVRADEHYSLSLAGYTCAAAPVLDPLTGRVEGCVNLTTWSESSSDLLLALAQSAAGNTSAMMLARSQGQHPRPAPRGEVFRVETAHSGAGSGIVDALSPSWRGALESAKSALAEHGSVLLVGEAGSGRATVLARALRASRPRGRILSAGAPAARDVEAWLDLWTPELPKPDTAVVIRDVDRLPARAADTLAELLRRAGDGVPVTVTASNYDDVPTALAGLLRTVVELPALRHRPEDISPLALHLAGRVRGRAVTLTAAAERALREYSWPGNVAEVATVMHQAAIRADVIGVEHLPPEVLSRSTHRLTRIETFERDEMIRVLSRPGITMNEAAEELGMSRATIYRKRDRYGITLRS
ncbi:Fis family transcriptional regulator [Rhodococcus sp. 06-235-1A]|uniref:helix-turn-helix domain-containing protein n=1 Tax=Rhodococcus sp. 06-235-1A TaxID=2022508 RepID=UPI000B9B5FA7|nr:helix-turn-helix domain-containing protein [Rhodococcus sp. 06-235-1A]OZC97692.1 Fis family transcriptional regulator [Rhodococcus sp. 06-235-1A]